MYPLPYVLLLLFFGICAFLFEHTERKERQVWINIAVITAFFFFFGFRGFILSDWTSYYPYFQRCDINDVINYRFGGLDLEPGFTILNLACKFITKDYSFFVLVCTTINTALLFCFLRKYTYNIPLALVVVIAFEGIVINTDLIRNSIAILIFLNAIPYIEQRKPIQYFLLCFLAISFHTSALIYLPLYFFVHKPLNRWVYLSCFILLNCFYFMHISILTTLLSLMGYSEDFIVKIKIYTEVYDKSAIFSLGYLERLITGILIFSYYNKLKNMHAYNSIFIYAILIHHASFFLLSEYQVFSQRICTLFVFGYWIIWPDLAKCFYYKNNQVLFHTFLILYCTLRTIGTTNHPDYEYENILFGAKSYQEKVHIHDKNYSK